MKLINDIFVYRWTFDLYDLNGDGVITKDEMEDIIASVNIIFYFSKKFFFSNMASFRTFLNL